MEVDVGLGDSMGADDDVDGAPGEALERLPFLRRRTEPRQRPDGEGELREPGGEAVPVLLAEDGGGDEDGHLMARLDRLERRPHRHLRFPEADVAAQQPVHRAGPFHVGPDRVGRRLLIGCGIEREGVGELPLPGGVGRESDAGAALPLGLQLDHVGGHVGDRLTDRLLLLFPQLAPHLGELRRELAAADVLLHQLDGRGGDVDPRRLGELQIQILLRPPFLLEQPQALVTTDAVGDMDDVVAFVEIEERVDRPRESLPGSPRRHVLAAEQLGARDEDELLRHEAEAAGEVTAGEVEAAAAGRRARGEELGEPRLLRLRRANDPHFLIAAHRLQFIANTVEHAGEPLDTLHREIRARLEARRGDRRERHRREAIDPPEHFLRLGEPDIGAEPLERPPRLVGELAGLHQRPPRSGRHDIGQLRAALRDGGRGR